jgi:hypothetical protein
MTNLFPKFIFFILSGLLLSGCAPVDYSHEASYPEARADKALIYFYRTPGFIGSTYRFNVYENKKLIGAMAQDSYFYVFTDAGEHTYYVDDKNDSAKQGISLMVEAGKVYYIKVDVNYRVVGGKPVFTIVDKAEAMKLLPTRKYVVPAKVESSNYNIHAEQ